MLKQVNIPMYQVVLRHPQYGYQTVAVAVTESAAYKAATDLWASSGLPVRVQRIHPTIAQCWEVVAEWNAEAHKDFRRN